MFRRRELGVLERPLEPGEDAVPALDRVGEVGWYDDVLVVWRPVAEVIAELHRLRHRVAEPRQHGGDVLLVALRPVREVPLPCQHSPGTCPTGWRGRHGGAGRRASQASVEKARSVPVVSISKSGTGRGQDEPHGLTSHRDWEARHRSARPRAARALRR